VDSERCYASPKMLEDIRKKMESGIGSISKQNPDEIGAAVIGKAREAAEQLTGLAVGIVEWSAAAREHLMSDVRDLVAQTVDQMGLAKGADLDALSKRVAKLEKAAGGGARSGSGAGARGEGSKAKAATARKKKSSAKGSSSSADR
jgi:hypothetical protein